MLRYVFAALVALVVAMPARAELKVDIIAGAAEPISIAVQKFEVSDDVPAKGASMMRGVGEND